MKTTEHRLITIYFLEMLREKHQETEQLNSINPTYLFLLHRDELIIIINMMYHGEADKEHPNLHEKTKEELLEIIKDEYYILQYMIEEVWGVYTL